MHMKPQPMIVVHDIEATSAWYQAVLGLRSGHQEIWLGDPKGYKVVVASPCGDVGPAPGGA